MDPAAAAIAWASPLLRWSGVPHLPAMPRAALRGIAPMRRGGFCGFAEDGPICDPNELLLDRTDLLQQANWVQHGPQLLHSALHLLAGPWVRDPSLTRCRRGMVALPDQCPVTHLSGQLERGLEEIHEQPHRGIQARQRRRGFQTLEPPIANRATHDRAILLLHPGLVILAIGAAAGELDPDLLAIISNGLVHEHAVVVGVEPKQWERQQLAYFAQYLRQQPLFAH